MNSSNDPNATRRSSRDSSTSSQHSAKRKQTDNANDIVLSSAKKANLMPEMSPEERTEQDIAWERSKSRFQLEVNNELTEDRITETQSMSFNDDLFRMNTSNLLVSTEVAECVRSYNDLIGSSGGKLKQSDAGTVFHILNKRINSELKRRQDSPSNSINLSNDYIVLKLLSLFMREIIEIKFVGRTIKTSQMRMQEKQDSAINSANDIAQKLEELLTADSGNVAKKIDFMSDTIQQFQRSLKKTANTHHETVVLSKTMQASTATVQSTTQTTVVEAKSLAATTSSPVDVSSVMAKRGVTKELQDALMANAEANRVYEELLLEKIKLKQALQESLDVKRKECKKACLALSYLFSSPIFGRENNADLLQIREECEPYIQKFTTENDRTKHREMAAVQQFSAGTIDLLTKFDTSNQLHEVLITKMQARILAINAEYDKQVAMLEQMNELDSAEQLLTDPEKLLIANPQLATNVASLFGASSFRSSFADFKRADMTDTALKADISGLEAQYGNVREELRMENARVAREIAELEAYRKVCEDLRVQADAVIQPKMGGM